MQDSIQRSIQKDLAKYRKFVSDLFWAENEQAKQAKMQRELSIDQNIRQGMVI